MGYPSPVCLASSSLPHTEILHLARVPRSSPETTSGDEKSAEFE